MSSPGLTDAPEEARGFIALGLAAVHAGQAERGLRDFDRALSLSPTLASAHAGRAFALAALGRGEEAVASYARAAQLAPHDMNVYLEVGQLLLRLGRLDNALAAFGAVLETWPDDVRAQEGRAMTLIALNRYEEAVPALADLRRLAPGLDYLPGQHFHARLQCCDWGDYHAARAAIAERVRRGERVDRPLGFIVHSESPAAQRHCAETYVADKLAITARISRHPPRPDSGRLRIAYLSADFRHHPVAQLLIGVLESHDKSRIETFGLCACADDGSDLRQRVVRSVDHFWSVADAQDQALAQRIADARIDIVVDLGGHTTGSRTRALAYRPAPLQVAFLGYPGTSGAGYIDYLIADRQVIPELDTRHYTESVIYLPDTYLPPNCAPINPPCSRQQAGLPPSGFVFCSFNAPYKLTPPMFDCWMRILKAVPDSVLWLREMPDVAMRNLAQEAAARGVDPARLLYARRTARLADHLARLSLADLFLDTTPYNAHTTAGDALGAAVPVVTLRGNTFASRVAGSLLHAVGLMALCADSWARYEELAIDIAKSPGVLAGLKQHLRDARGTAPLFDTPRYTRHLEAAYAAIWARHQRGEPASMLRVAAEPPSSSIIAADCAR